QYVLACGKCPCEYALIAGLPDRAMPVSQSCASVERSRRKSAVRVHTAKVLASIRFTFVPGTFSCRGTSKSAAVARPTNNTHCRGAHPMKSRIDLRSLAALVMAALLASSGTARAESVVATSLEWLACSAE